MSTPDYVFSWTARTGASLLVLAAVAVAPTTASAAPPGTPGRLGGGGKGDVQLLGGRVAARRAGSTFGRFAASAARGVPRRSRAFSRLRAETGPLWIAWDDATGVPRHALLSGAEAAGTTTGPAVAAGVAQQFLADHIAVLAPGSSPGDFVLVSNHLSAGMRTVAFEQYQGSRRVLGGQLSFHFKHDRLVGFASEAVPIVDHVPEVPTPDYAQARASAVAWAEATPSPKAGAAVAGAVSGPEILAVQQVKGMPKLFEVLVIEVHGPGPAQAWRVFVDTSTGQPVARESLFYSAAATLSYNAPLRSPSVGPRVSFPAAGAELVVGNANVLTDAQGAFSFPGPTAGVTTTLAGPSRVIMLQSGMPATAIFTASDGEDLEWNAGELPTIDAQVSAFVHGGIAKEFARVLDPDLAYLDQQTEIWVNMDGECNAFTDGEYIGMYVANNQCENMARIADVVYHESGHMAHLQGLVRGSGHPSGALLEGVADYFAAAITGDPQIGPGIFFGAAALRDLDPEGKEFIWPQDDGEAHAAGLIIGGTLWDLRKALVLAYGDDEGETIANSLYFEAARRSVDMLSMYPQTLLADDDDGDLSNGTPNGCAINAAYSAHGLFSTGTLEGESLTTSPASGGYDVGLQFAVPSFPECPIAAGLTLEYRTRGSKVSSSVAMQAARGGYAAFMPVGRDGEVLEYRVLVEYSLGATDQLPDNPADPWYQISPGDAEPIYCTSFEPEAAEQWSMSEGFTISSPEVDDGSGDAPSGYDDLGGALVHSRGSSGYYASGALDSAHSEIIAFDPALYSSVHLQFRRWLTVQDGLFDQATVAVDDEVLWQNFTSAQDNDGLVHHVDLEWRFQDIDVTEQAADGELQISFALESDASVRFGGWTVDQLCVVGVAEETADSGTSSSGGDPGSSGGADTDTDADADTGSQTSSGTGAQTSGAQAGAVGDGCACTIPGRKKGRASETLMAVLLLGVGARRRRRRKYPAGPGRPTAGARLPVR